MTNALLCPISRFTDGTDLACSDYRGFHIGVLLMSSFLRTQIADPVYTIENRSRAGNERSENCPDKISLSGVKHGIFRGERI
jgi:hypothetical protein